MPDGLQQVIDGIDVLSVEIQDVIYAPAENVLRIAIKISNSSISREDVSQVSNALTAYLRTEQFTEFMADIQEINDGTFSVSLDIRDAENELIFRLGTTAHDNFSNWGNGFGEVYQLLAATVGCASESYGLALIQFTSVRLRMYHMAGNIVVVWADSQLNDFKIIDVSDGESEQAEEAMPYLYAGKSQLTIEELLPGRLFVLHEVFASGTVQPIRIAFSDEYDVQRSFLLSVCTNEGLLVQIR